MNGAAELMAVWAAGATAVAVNASRHRGGRRRLLIVRPGTPVKGHDPGPDSEAPPDFAG